MSEQETPINNRGGRNLFILGIGSCLIALITTSISIYIYRASGDIYIDRSLPGFISNEDKNEEDEGDVNTAFSSDGEITSESLDTYLEELDSLSERIDSLSEDFSSDALSDQNLSIDPTLQPDE